MGKDEQRHDDVFGHCRLMAEHVANGGALWPRGGIEEVQRGGYRLQQAKARRGREPRPANMTNDDLRTRQQRGKMRRIGLLVEDRGLQRRLHLGENAWRDGGGKMCKKWDFDTALPSQPTIKAPLTAPHPTPATN